MKKRVAVVGTSEDPRKGVVARDMIQRVNDEGHEVCFTLGRKDEVKFGDLLAEHRPDGVGICPSTLDRGEAELRYILACANAGIPSAISAKGAVAWQGVTLRPHANSFGCSGACGGGMLMLPYIDSRRLNHCSPFRMDAVINTTTSFIASEQAQGRSFGQAWGEAERQHIVEPNSTDHFQGYQVEVDDFGLKTCVIFFKLGVRMGWEEFLTPEKLGRIVLTQKIFRELMNNGGDYRLILSVSNRKEMLETEFLGEGFDTSFGGFFLTGGFRRVSGRSQYGWLPSGLGNAVRIVEGHDGEDGYYELKGTGASPRATSRAMWLDLKSMMGL